MAIHDTDKNSAGRESPMPNSHDEQGLTRMAAGTTSFNPTTDATNLTTAPPFTGNFRVVKTDTATMPIATATTVATTIGFGNANTTIAHGFSYAPVVMAFIKGFGGVKESAMLPYFLNSGGSGIRVINMSFQITTDETNVYLTSTIESWSVANDTRSDVTPSNLTVKYYLLQETSN